MQQGREEPTMRFALGQIVATPGALQSVQRAEQSPAEFLDRHVLGDWGNVDEEDRKENECSLQVVR